jgi:RNA polymerase sigma factor (sigma-70 family)
MDTMVLEMPGQSGAAGTRRPLATGAPRAELTPEVVAAAIRGDRAALATLVHALRPVVQASVAGVLRSGASRAEVEDLVQEAFVLLLEDERRRLRAWDPSRGTAYIKAIARNAVLSHLRGKAKRLAWSDALSLDDLDLEPEAGTDLEGEALQNQHWDAILAALRADLSDHEHQILLLLLDGLGAREICTRTGTKTENAVHSVRQRIVAKAEEIRKRLYPGHQA